MDINDLPNAFQTQSKRKQARYGLSNDMKKPKTDGKTAKPPGFLEMRKKEIHEDEAKDVDQQKLQPITVFLDENDQKIKTVDIPYSSLEVFFLLFLYYFLLFLYYFLLFLYYFLLFLYYFSIIFSYFSIIFSYFSIIFSYFSIIFSIFYLIYRSYSIIRTPGLISKIRILLRFSIISMKSIYGDLI